LCGGQAQTRHFEVFASDLADENGEQVPVRDVHAVTLLSLLLAISDHG
jgi:hypothetical protein